MIVRCSNCGSAVTQALLDINQCLDCGVYLEQDGTVRPSRGEQEAAPVSEVPVSTVAEEKPKKK